MFKKKEAEFTYFNEEWNGTSEETKAQPKDDYGDTHIDGVDEWIYTTRESSTIED